LLIAQETGKARIRTLGDSPSREAAIGADFHMMMAMKRSCEPSPQPQSENDQRNGKKREMKGKCKNGKDLI
jgi:hypothetical protein